MYYLIVFFAFVYAAVGIWTMFHALTALKSNAPASLLAGAFWPLFWLTGQAERNRRLRGGGNRYLP
jgi:hypothetical protein